jgi:hypothetical protein
MFYSQFQPRNGTPGVEAGQGPVGPPRGGYMPNPHAHPNPHQYQLGLDQYQNLAPKVS